MLTVHVLVLHDAIQCHISLHIYIYIYIYIYIIFFRITFTLLNDYGK